MAFKVPTIKEIRELGGRAAFGDNEALQELGKLAERMARAANTRLRRLEAAGKTGDAYQRAKEILGGGKRFPQARTGSAEQLGENLEKATSFLRKKESTISGIREVDKKTAQTFLGRDDVTQKDVNRLNRIFESKAWPELKKNFSSSDLQEKVQDLILNNEDVEDVISLFETWDPDDFDGQDIIELAESTGMEF